MPIHHFDTAIVINLSTIKQTLRSFDGDSVTIMPGAEVRIMHKFLEWQTPSPKIIRVLSTQFKPDEPVFETKPIEPEVAPEKDDVKPTVESEVVKEETVKSE